MEANDTDYCDRLPGQHTGRLSLELQSSEAAESKRRIAELELMLVAAADTIRRLTPPATPSAEVGASGPVAECAICGGVLDHWYVCPLCEGTGKDVFDSKPTNCPESEDTPPRGNDVPVSDTVPPEIGKRYVCRNGEVTEAMEAGLRIQTYPFRASVNGVTRTWMRDGKHDESKSSEYDLIAEYHEPEPSPPAESPDDWVTQDRVPLRKCDEYRWKWNDGTFSPWGGNCESAHKHGDSEARSQIDVPDGGCYEDTIEIRCRRKDLPPVPVVKNSVERGKLPPVDASKLPSIPREVLDERSEWREQAAAWSELFRWCCRNGFDCADNRYNGLTGLGTLAQWILDLKSAAKPNNQNASPPVVTKTRTVTLCEYQRYGDGLHWSTSDRGLKLTGRTCEVEVPE